MKGETITFGRHQTNLRLTGPIRVGGSTWGRGLEGDSCTNRQIRYSVSIGISLEDVLAVVISRFQHRYALKKSKSKQKYICTERSVAK